MTVDSGFERALERHLGAIANHDDGKMHRFALFLLFTRNSDAEWRLAYDQGTPIVA